MKLVPTKNITLENVKNSDYWSLLSICVWSHLKEERFKEESRISFSEGWYGKGGPGHSRHGREWNDPNYSLEGYTRTLKKITITYKEIDKSTDIIINPETGNISKFSSSVGDVGINKNVEICNWLLDNGFLTIVSTL